MLKQDDVTCISMGMGSFLKLLIASIPSIDKLYDLKTWLRLELLKILQAWPSFMGFFF